MLVAERDVIKELSAIGTYPYPASITLFITILTTRVAKWLDQNLANPKQNDNIKFTYLWHYVNKYMINKPIIKFWFIFCHNYDNSRYLYICNSFLHLYFQILLKRMTLQIIMYRCISIAIHLTHVYTGR